MQPAPERLARRAPVSRRNLLQSIFLIVGARPSGMRRAGGVRSVNAAIVGLLLAALYQPV